MGKSSPSPPAPPDPTVVATAQAQANLQTAQQQQQLNQVNQVTPYGSLTYTPSPTSNNPYQTTATTSLSPAEQSNLAASQQAQNTYGQIGNAQLSQVQGALSQPINTNWNQTQQQQVQSQLGLIQPQIQQQQNNLNAQLASQGVAQGSDAWNNAQRSMASTNAQVYGNILSNSVNTTGAAIQQQESLRDQPLNEASALLTGSQVSQPQFQQVPQEQEQAANLAQAYGMQQQGEQFNYQQQMANQSSMLGGIAGLAGTVAGSAMGGPLGGMLGGALGSMAGGAASGSVGGNTPISSDRRMKENERRVGSLMLPTGELPLKTFNFRGQPIKRLGLIAQDVERHNIPGAVRTDPRSRMKAVNYATVLRHAAMGRAAA